MLGNIELTQQIYNLLFEHLPLAQRGPKRVSAGQIIIPRGTVPERVYCLASGSIQLEWFPATDDGNRVIPLTFYPQTVIPLFSVYTQQPHSGDLVAAEDSLLYPVSYAEFHQVMHADVKRLELVIQLFANRVVQSVLRERRWIERGVEARLASTLRYLADEGPDRSDQPKQISITHEALAERCGLSRAKVSKELKRLETAHVLRLERGTIEILDLQALKLF